PCGFPLASWTPGSHVPRESPNRDHAAFMPVTTESVSRSRLGWVPGPTHYSLPELLSSACFGQGVAPTILLAEPPLQGEEAWPCPVYPSASTSPDSATRGATT